jgi:hypothetical protein
VIEIGALDPDDTARRSDGRLPATSFQDLDLGDVADL